MAGMHIHTHMHTLMHTHMHTNTCTHTRMHAHTHTQVSKYQCYTVPQSHIVDFIPDSWILFPKWLLVRINNALELMKTNRHFTKHPWAANKVKKTISKSLLFLSVRQFLLLSFHQLPWVLWVPASNEFHQLKAALADTYLNTVIRNMLSTPSTSAIKP